jgi:flagellar motor component MotA
LGLTVGVIIQAIYKEFLLVVVAALAAVMAANNVNRLTNSYKKMNINRGVHFFVLHTDIYLKILCYE